MRRRDIPRTQRRISAVWSLLKTRNAKDATTMRDLTPAQLLVIERTQTNLTKTLFRE